MNETMTVQQVLEISINNLNAIQVPIGLTQQIGEPILGVINNLRLCIDAMTKKQEPEPEKDEVIDLGEIGGNEDEHADAE